MAHKSAPILPPMVRRVGYAAWQAMLRWTTRDEIVVWPPVESQEQMDDIFGRLRHYFASGERIAVPRADASIRPRRVVPPYIHDVPVRAQFRFPVVRDGGASPLGVALGHRGVLLIDGRRHPRSTAVAQFLPSVAPLGPDMVTLEGMWVAKLQESPQRRQATRDSHRQFLKWRDGLPRKKKVYLLCTGPSLSRFREFDFSDGHVIGCNTVVKNQELMEHTRPVMVAAIDANFFFGPSVYASRFRADLIEAMERHPFAFATLECFYQTMRQEARELMPRMFFLPLDHQGVVPQLDHEWELPRVGNVLTGIMLPLARALADDIYVIGADGRAPGEEYFWKHDPASQLSDKLQAMKDCHPKFFHATNYEDYYDRHCEVLEGQIRWIEQRGGRVRSLTESYIPALRSRPAAG